MSKMNRREFFKGATQIALGAVVVPALFKGELAHAEERRKASGPVPLVDPNDPVAKAVGYVEDAKKSATAKGNKCATCGFYKKTETRDGKEVGTCTIFQGKLVRAEGYCNSWNKKQG